MGQQLRSLAASLGLGETVDFLGFVDEMEVLMSLATVVVLPSLSEGLPNVALETFALSRPLVATRVGGLIDLSEYNSDAILLTEPNNSVDLADNIEKVLTNPSLAHQLSQAGRTVVETELSSINVASRYGRLYREVVDQTRRIGGQSDGYV